MSGRATITAENVGVRFDFDRRSRVVSRTLATFRRIKTTSWGLRGVDLDLEPGAGLALVGPTGSGKTTLLRVIAGVIVPDEGTITVDGRIGSLLATEAGVGGLLTGRENSQLLCVLAGLSLDEARERLDEVAELSHLAEAFERPVYTYSEGMRARLHFAVIQVTNPNVMLLDEVFEALDHEFRGLVENYARALRERGGIVVAAGHDHPALQLICPRAAFLADGRMQAAGDFAETVETYRG